MKNLFRSIAVLILLAWAVSALAGGLYYSPSLLQSPSLGTTPLTTTYTAGSGGTTAGLLVKLDSSARVVTASTSDVGIIGIAMTSVAQDAAVEVATRGQTTCVADNTTIIGDVLIPGTSTGGRCRDSGLSNNALVNHVTQVVGKALSVVSAGSAVSLQLFGPGHYGADPGRTCNTEMWASPTGSDTMPSMQGTATAIGTAGLVHCTRMTAQCTIAGVALYWRVVTGLAGQTCAVAIYNSTGTTQIATSPESTTCASNNQNRSATGLSFTLTAGTEYLVCQANSGTTVAFAGNSQSSGNWGTTTNVVDGQNATANKYQANADCLASTNPYACCTGVGTGTCTGMPSSLGTLATGSTSSYAFVLVQ